MRENLDNSETSFVKPSPKLKAWISTALAILVFAVFWPTVNHLFINFDDPDYVSQNPIVQRGLTWEGVQWAFTAAFSSNWHPITWISHMLDCQLFGLDAGLHHLANLLWHSANAILVFLLLNRMFASPWRCAFVAGLFAVHPLHVESVAWVAERKDLLSTFFFLLTLWAYLRYSESCDSEQTRTRAWRFYALALLLFALGLMSKPMIVTLPFVLLLLDYWPLKRISAPSSGSRCPAKRSEGLTTNPVAEGGAFIACIKPLVLEKIPFFILSGISCTITIWAQGTGHSIQSADGFPVFSRITNAFCSYLNYLVKTFWPADLAIFYPHPGSATVPSLLISVILVAGISVFAWRNRHRRPWELMGWLWFSGTLVPVIGLVQVGDQAMADRYTYIPLLGIFVLLTWDIAEFSKNRVHRRLLYTGGSVIVVLCAGLAMLQVRHWKDTETLFRHANSVTRSNYVAQTVLGTVLASRGHTDEAIALYLTALKAKPNYPEAAVALGLAYHAKSEQGKAIEMFSQALKFNPYAPEANKFYGIFLANKQRWTEAEVCLRLAVRFLPGDLDILSNLANALHSQGNLHEAIAYYQRAMLLSPESFSLHQGLGNALLAQGQFAEAISEFRKVLELKPDSIEALNRLAWVLATHQDSSIRNGAQAVQLATKACQLSNSTQPLPLISLAAAQAETGQFAEAVRTAQKALELARSASQTGMAEVISKLVELFRSGRPYRESSVR